MVSQRNEIRVGSFSFYAGGGRSVGEWRDAAKQLLEQGQPFLAYDVASTALGLYPDSLLLKETAASALIRTGALQEAVGLLEPLCPDPRPDVATLQGIFESLRVLLHSVASHGAGESASAQARGSLERLIRQVNDAGLIQPAGSADEETRGLLASAYKAIWRRTGEPEDGRRARDAYLRAFRATKGYWTGINAATMSRLVGEVEEAEGLPAEVLELCRAALLREGNTDETFWILATMGEACLLQGRPAEALEHYRRAAGLPERKPASIVSALRQVLLLKEHDERLVPEALLSVLAPPTVVVFSGHMIDHPDRKTPRFPASLEVQVAAQIRRQLDDLDARIGYCSAACGSDILFAEAMFERGAEVYVLLPFNQADFVKESVEFAGPQWVRRFHRVVRLADSVRYVTEEQYLGAEVLFHFAAEVLNGYAEMHARALETAPHLLVTLDETSPVRVGGTADVVSRWPDPERLRVIPLSALRAEREVPLRSLVRIPSPPAMPVESAPAPPAGSPARKRVVRTLLFADVVGYSKLDEEHTPFYFEEFLKRVAAGLPHERPPELVNTWGDAVFAVMREAIPMVEYALALQAVVCETDWAGMDLSMPLPQRFDVRIGLHAGPVFEADDPIAGRPNVYGAHVNRAARIEPVTRPGHIYASDQFVALLTAEQAACEKAARLEGRPYRRPFVTEYVGVVPLAKGFGLQAVHEIRRVKGRSSMPTRPPA